MGNQDASERHLFQQVSGNANARWYVYLQIYHYDITLQSRDHALICIKKTTFSKHTHTHKSAITRNAEKITTIFLDSDIILIFCVSKSTNSYAQTDSSGNSCYRNPGLCPCQSTWNLWWTKRHWGMFFSKFPLSISFLIWRMGNGPVRSSFPDTHFHTTITELKKEKKNAPTVHETTRQYCFSFWHFHIGTFT